MSTRPLFIFVEGHIDHYLFGRLCEASLAKDEYELVPSVAVPESPKPGKHGLLALYRFLRGKKSLCDILQGKRTYVLFFLDKDVDDVLGTRARSEHVLYTQHYDIECHLFEDGDVVGALAATAQIPPGAAAAVFASGLSTWRESVAQLWKRWMTLCLCASILDAGGPATFSRVSQVNTNTYGPYDSQLEAQFVLLLQGHSSGHSFAAAMGRAEGTVEASFRRAQFARLFCGKWYPGHVTHALTQCHSGISQAQLNGLERRLVSTLSYSISLHSDWFTPYRDALHVGRNWCANAAQTP